MSKRVLAFDFGASSGRAILATYESGKITLEEIHRFSNDPVKVNGTWYWDVLRLFFEIKEGIRKAAHSGGFDSLGIDTWGVDYAFLDKNGKMLENPVHYRDSRTDTILEEAFALIPRKELYEKTGIQIMNFNTVFQLLAVRLNNPDQLEKADKLLFMPDLLTYFLTGEKNAEYTIASTAQLLNAKTRTWDEEVLDKIGISKDLLPGLVEPGTIVGSILPEIAEETNSGTVPVIAVAAHDTGSAVLAVPSVDEHFIYISCGTWSLLGTELKEPITNELSASLNLTNEGGYGRTIRYLKNIMGLWLIQESRRQWQREGQQVTFALLEEEALRCEAFKCFVDPDDARFGKPGDLPSHIQSYCRETGQYVPQTRGEIVRCIYESLALKYRYALSQVEKATGIHYGVIHMVGGGTKDKFLCQLTADACSLPVAAGPIEATALGNAAVQLMALGEIKDIGEARRVIAASFELLRYKPSGNDGWDKAYDRFTQLINKKH